MSIGVMKDSKTKDEESTRLPCTGLCHKFLLSCILKDVSFGEVCNVCRVAFREPIHLGPVYMRERGGG